jgi:hypothetical protein
VESLLWGPEDPEVKLSSIKKLRLARVPEKQTNYVKTYDWHHKDDQYIRYYGQDRCGCERREEPAQCQVDFQVKLIFEWLLLVEWELSQGKRLGR